MYNETQDTANHNQESLRFPNIHPDFFNVSNDANHQLTVRNNMNPKPGALQYRTSDQISMSFIGRWNQLKFEHQPVAAYYFNGYKGEWMERGKGKVTVHSDNDGNIWTLVFTEEQTEEVRLFQTDVTPY